MKNQKKHERDYIFAAAVGIAVAGLCCAVLNIAAVGIGVTSPLLCSVIAAVIYAGAVVAILIYTRSRIRQTFTAGGNVPDSILRDSVLNMSFPMLICESSAGKIIWYNKASAVLSDNTSLFGRTFGELFGISLDEAVPEGGEAPIAECAGHFWQIAGRRVGSADKTFVIVTLEDVTELKKMRDTEADRETAVVYVIADNLGELAEYERERYRDASAEIARILTEWAESAGGVLKEYDHDRYLCLINGGKLRENMERKFDVLDRVRDLRIGDSAVPVTVSAGVSVVGSTLLEREKYAKQALEMALQRGGDQVVVKGESSVEFYGGRTKTVQKRTKVRARVFANELLMHMAKSSSVIVMGHRFADYDCFGAAVGIAKLAMFCGVPVHIVTDMSDSGMDACRAMMAKDKDYSGVFIDRSQALDIVDSDILLVIVDVNNMATVELPDLVSRCENYVVIDHHRKTAEFEREPIMTYIEPSSAATCELVAEMLEQCLPDEMITVREANLMLAGITLDTKQFTKNTGTRTFGAALYLRDAGADPGDVQELFKTSLEDFRREAKFRSNVVIYRRRYAVALGDGDGENADRIAAAKAADKLLTVEGVIASFALIRIGGAVHISARSTGQVNVQLILEELSGGGHFDSAGAQVEAESVVGALEMLKGAIDRYEGAV